MKKLVFLLSILFIGSTQGMYYQGEKLRHEGEKLKYDEVTLINKSPISLELSWVELKRPELTQQTIRREIMPGETITVKLGEVGLYLRKPAKIIYSSTAMDKSIKQEFIIDLPNSKAFAFTAVTMADIMKNIWVPGVFTADDEGNFSSFQYMNLHHPTEWEKVLKKVGAVKAIK